MHEYKKIYEKNYFKYYLLLYFRLTTNILKSAHCSKKTVGSRVTLSMDSLQIPRAIPCIKYPIAVIGEGRWNNETA